MFRHPHLNLSRHLRRRTTLTTLQRVVLFLCLSIACFSVVYVGMLMVGFYAVKFHVTDVPGIVDPHSEQFDAFEQALASTGVAPQHLPAVDDRGAAAKKLAAAQDICQLKTIGRSYPVNGQKISAAMAAGAPHTVIAKMVFAVRLRVSADAALVTALDACLSHPSAAPPVTLAQHTENVFPWANREEWGVASVALQKDLSVIRSAGTVTGVEARMIVAAGFVEQMRLYFTQREVYEKFFRPLKILGNATQFAWGVMAIKEATAIDVENHLRAASSPYYLGPTREHALDFSGAGPAKERLQRLTDEKDHLYSYLYGGFELAQFRSQWRRAGFPIDSRPEILATLYNIGFGRSQPNNHPQVGGSVITIADTQYTFGSLAFEFYYSGEMLDAFPYLSLSDI